MTTRKQILEMLSAGEIDVTRATELLNEARAGNAVPVEGEPSLPPAPPPAPEKTIAAAKQGGPRWLHIHVSELESGKSRVRVNVPLGLVHFGLRIGAHFTDEIDNDVIRDMMSALSDKELVGTLVEVEDLEDNERVHVFVD